MHIPAGGHEDMLACRSGARDHLVPVGTIGKIVPACQVEKQIPGAATARLEETVRRRLEKSRYHSLTALRIPDPLQGLEDRVVPPSQAEAMRDALIANGTPVAYLAFPGEGHGFRSADARVRALEAELWFYRKVLGLEADRIEGVEAVGL